MSVQIKYTLFYAGGDPESMNIYNIILQNEMGRLFEATDVTKMSVSELERLHMKNLPTIVISSANTRPDVRDGPSACAQFLNTMIVNRRATQIQEAESRMKMIQRAQKESRLKTEGPSEYSEAEMAGTSDNYSYMQSDVFQPKSFVLVGQEDSVNVITPQLNESKIGNKQMTSDLSALERQRKQDLNSYKSDMEQRQIDAIFGMN
jgi:hypothetical protein